MKRIPSSPNRLTSSQSHRVIDLYANPDLPIHPRMRKCKRDTVVRISNFSSIFFSFIFYLYICVFVQILHSPLILRNSITANSIEPFYKLLLFIVVEKSLCRTNTSTMYSYVDKQPTRYHNIIATSTITTAPTFTCTHINKYPPPQTTCHTHNTLTAMSEEKSCTFSPNEEKDWERSC